MYPQPCSWCGHHGGYHADDCGPPGYGSGFICHCPQSTARDGHVHEIDGSVLCLHHLGEAGAFCPQATLASESHKESA